MAYFPVMLEIEGSPCLVVGGGRVASRKVKDLLACGAKVTVISPEVTPELARLAAEGKIRHFCRGYQPGDGAGYWLIIAATDDAPLNRRIATEARERGSLVNVVDCAEDSNFIVPAVVRRGDLVVAISTGGASPALARQLRQKLEQEYGPEYGLLLLLLKRLRPVVLHHYPAGSVREEIFHRLAGSGLKEVLARRDKTGVMRELEKVLGEVAHQESVTEAVEEVCKFPPNGKEVVYGDY